MGERFFASDPHWGHEGILNVPGRKEFFSGKNIHYHDEYLIEEWNEEVGKRDTVWLTGDVGFDRPTGYLTLGILPRLNGQINLVAGNHDNQAIIRAKRWHQVMGVETMTVKGYHLIITHIPIHPQEMFWDLNVHGHLHSNQVKERANDPQGGKYGMQRDIRYACVSMEHTGYAPIPVDQVIDDWVKRGGQKVELGEFRRR